jgi:predicted DNA-binding transcriptional regulator AlpA
MPKALERHAVPPNLSMQRILCRAQVAQLYGISLPTLNRLRRAGKLPPAIQLSERRIGWRVHDLIEHLKAQPPAGASASRAET